MDRVISELERYLNKQDLVILIDIDKANRIVDRLCDSEAVQKTQKRLAIFSTVNYPKRRGNHVYVTVSEKEMKDLLEIYRTYEFSDKLTLLADSKNYGTMWNYVDSGILTPNDVFEALLL